MKKAEIDWKKLESQLRAALSDNRYRHTLGVMYTAAAMAMRYGADMEQARLAGILHDCAKCISNEEKIRICKKEHLPVSAFELDHPVLLHAKLGAFLARKTYHVKNEEVLSAITWHTTGKPEMTLLEKILYIADYIEPNRDKAPNLTRIREAAFADIDHCMYLILGDTVDYLRENPKSMDPMTLEAYAYYQKIEKKKEMEACEPR